MFANSCRPGSESVDLTSLGFATLDDFHNKRRAIHIVTPFSTATSRNKTRIFYSISVRRTPYYYTSVFGHLSTL